jgi:prolyl oligopeptidase
MCALMSPPFSPIEPVTDILHGIPVTDPYRWLEDHNSPQTRAWVEEQTRYARAYLDRSPGRAQIRGRVKELVDVETYDFFLKSGTRYFFRKRLQGQEQPCIYFREAAEGGDQLLIDPGQRGTGDYTSVIPLRISPDGNLLLYEVKQRGERAGTFEILDIANRRTLSDSLSHGYLRGFAFAPDSKRFYYIHEATGVKMSFYRAAYEHVLGGSCEEDREVFCAGEDRRIRLAIVPGPRQLGLLVYRFFDKTYTDFYVWRMSGTGSPVPVLRDSDYSFAPRFLRGRILAVTDRDAPNRRIVEVQPRKNQDPLFFNLIPETDALIRNWVITANHIFVSYAHGTKTKIHIFDSHGKPFGHIPCEENDTVRLASGDPEQDEILLERESFTHPVEIDRYSASSGERSPWMSRRAPLDAASYGHRQVYFPSKDGTSIPMFLVGMHDVLEGGAHPTIMTSYGGYGVPMTPQFSVFVAFLLERGCLFALPNIRGGSEFGTEWHKAAKRRNRQVAVDDFLSAARWLIETGRTVSDKLAVFGGSNSGLLAAAALTQRPDLFRAVLIMVPLLDMLRYHLFDHAHVWKEEFGTSDDADDFPALMNYSPYHRVRDATAYPATMIVSGDADEKCNPLHARKMTARLQAANASDRPIFLDYSASRGHSPVLPLSKRVDSLTDRMAFLCHQLGLCV